MKPLYRLALLTIFVTEILFSSYAHAISEEYFKRTGFAYSIFSTSDWEDFSENTEVQEALKKFRVLNQQKEDAARQALRKNLYFEKKIDPPKISEIRANVNQWLHLEEQSSNPLHKTLFRSAAYRTWLSHHDAWKFTGFRAPKEEHRHVIARQISLLRRKNAEFAFEKANSERVAADPVEKALWLVRAFTELSIQLNSDDLGYYDLRDRFVTEDFEFGARILEDLAETFAQIPKSEQNRKLSEEFPFYERTNFSNSDHAISLSLAGAIYLSAARTWSIFEKFVYFKTQKQMQKKLPLGSGSPNPMNNPKAKEQIRSANQKIVQLARLSYVEFRKKSVEYELKRGEDSLMARARLEIATVMAGITLQDALIDLNRDFPEDFMEDEENTESLEDLKTELPERANKAGLTYELLMKKNSRHADIMAAWSYKLAGYLSDDLETQQKFFKKGLSLASEAWKNSPGDCLSNNKFTNFRWYAPYGANLLQELRRELYRLEVKL